MNPRDFRLRVFETRALGHYANPPVVRKLHFTPAEDEGFEPSIGCPIHAFQACALGRYANPPEGSTLSVAITMITPDPSYGATVLNSPRVGMQQG